MATLRARGGRSVTTVPLMTMSPIVGRSRPAISRISVVLPQPDGPSRTRNSPSFAMRSIPSTARTSSKSFVRRRASTVAMNSVPWQANSACSMKRRRRKPPTPRARLGHDRTKGRSDHLPRFPLRPDRLQLVVGARESVLGWLGARRRLGEHRVEHPGLPAFGDRWSRVAGIADIGRPVEHVGKNGVFVRRLGLRILGNELLQIRNRAGEAREVVELAGQESLLEVVDIVDQEFLGASNIL